MGKGKFFGGEIRQHNVTYRKHVALHCGCSIPMAEWLDSSALGIAQLVAHEVDEYILCMMSSCAAVHKLLWWHWGVRTYCLIFLLYVLTKFEFGVFLLREWLDSSAVCSVHCTAHAAREFILCHERLRCLSFQMSLGRISLCLLTYPITLFSYFSSYSLPYLSLTVQNRPAPFPGRTS